MGAWGARGGGNAVASTRRGPEVLAGTGLGAVSTRVGRCVLAGREGAGRRAEVGD